MLAIDVLSLALKSAIAFKSDRRWPIWIAGFQLNTVLAETAIAFSPAYHIYYFHAMATMWSLPALFIMFIGVYLDNAHDRNLRRSASFG